MPAKVDTNTIHNFVCGKDQTEHLNGNNVLDCMQSKKYYLTKKDFTLKETYRSRLLCMCIYFIN